MPFKFSSIRHITMVTEADLSTQKWFKKLLDLWFQACKQLQALYSQAEAVMFLSWITTVAYLSAVPSELMWNLPDTFYQLKVCKRQHNYSKDGCKHDSMPKVNILACWWSRRPRKRNGFSFIAVHSCVVRPRNWSLGHSQLVPHSHYRLWLPW